MCLYFMCGIVRYRMELEGRQDYYPVVILNSCFGFSLFSPHLEMKEQLRNFLESPII